MTYYWQYDFFATKKYGLKIRLQFFEGITIFRHGWWILLPALVQEKSAVLFFRLPQRSEEASYTTCGSDSADAAGDAAADAAAGI